MTLTSRANLEHCVMGHGRQRAWPQPFTSMGFDTACGFHDSNDSNDRGRPDGRGGHRLHRVAVHHTSGIVLELDPSVPGLAVAMEHVHAGSGHPRAWSCYVQC